MSPSESSGSPSERRPSSAPRFRVLIKVNGQPTPLKPFIHDIIGGGILGMIDGLKGAEDLETVEIRVETRTSDEPDRDD